MFVAKIERKENNKVKSLGGDNSFVTILPNNLVHFASHLGL